MTETSKDYATALFAVAKEMGAEQDFSEALATVLSLLTENPDYVELLASPAISKKERTAALEAAFEGAVPEKLLAFLTLLTENGHIRALSECVKEYEALYQVSKHISTAEVTSAVALTEKEKEALICKLEALCGHAVLLECATDKTLLGGMIVRVDGRVLDGSLKHRLHEVKEVIR